jgi:hypothetical protein
LSKIVRSEANGDDAILPVYEALNVDPKEEYTFQAEPWSDFDTELNDIVENFNKPGNGITTLAIIGVIITAAFIDVKRLTKSEK